jgi:O-antigen ligase
MMMGVLLRDFLPGISNWLLLLALAVIGTWMAVVVTVATRAPDRPWRHPGRLLSLTAWIITIATAAESVLNRLGHESPVWNIASYLLAFFLAAILLARGRMVGAPNKLLAGGVFAYSGIQVMSLFMNHQVDGHLVQILGLVYLPGLFVLIRSSTASRDQILRLCLHISSAIVCGSVLLGILLPEWAYLPGADAARRLPVLGLKWRLAGLTPHQNLLGVTAVVCVILAFALRARLRYLMLIVSLVAIGMAESRNAALTLVLVAIVSWLLGGRRFASRAFMALPILGLTAAGLIPSFSDTQGLGTGVDSLNGRTYIFELVLQHWFSRPVLGWGPLAFQTSAGTPFSSSGYLNAHNQFFEALVEVGVLGVVCLGLIIAGIIRIGWTHRHQRVYPCLVLTLLVSMSTETFLTLHLYGLSYVLVPAFLMMASLMSAGMDTGGLISKPRADQLANVTHLAGISVTDNRRPLIRSPDQSILRSKLSMHG